MKTIFSIIAFCLLFNIQYAQRIVEESMPLSNNQEVKLEFDFADDIKVYTWDKNEVYIKATVNINNGEDNDKFQFNTRKGSGYVSIESEIKDLDKMYGNCTTIIIKDGDTTITNGGHNKLDLLFEVFLPAKTELTLSTINGDIELKGLTGPLDISTINGEIDLHIPSSHKANIEMSTINGTMYTNFDLDLNDEKNNLCKIGGDVHTKLNGGGVNIDLETINGVIFLREAK